MIFYILEHSLYLVLNFLDTSYPPCITAFLNTFLEIRKPIQTVTIIQKKLFISNILPSVSAILPEYILYGKSLIYLNGNAYAIFLNQVGKNGIGTMPPINKSTNT